MYNQHTCETLTSKNAALLLVNDQVGTMNFGLTDLDALSLKNQTLSPFPALGAVRDGYDVYAVMDASYTVNAHALQVSMLRASPPLCKGRHHSTKENHGATHRGLDQVCRPH